ncbi:MAG: CHASE2 domain-containing protein [Cyanobacteria bacterium P01_G01_bin.39]
MKFQLEIQQIDQICLFKLGWGRGQQISTIVPYPDNLSQLYQTWHQAYLRFYKTALRAKVPKPKNKQGQISLPQDHHRYLVQVEAELLKEFHGWLRREELYEIRAKIAQGDGKQSPIQLFLTCGNELARLPWETWEIGAEFGSLVAIARTPTNINNSHINQVKRTGKPRILAILGDDTGLDLTSDRNSLGNLKQVAEIKLVTWSRDQSASEIKQQIQQALIDANGWSVLFFAGHSNETKITGGELAIAPNIAITVQEIANELKIAQANGLRFALFNSCCGLSIANSLIDLGLSQVAVMREAIHNQVAQVFLDQFLQGLASYQDVQQAIDSASKYLQQQKLTYPSAYLIPSLFCHPDAQLYRIQPWGWQHQLKKWLPNRYEAIAASALCLLSIMPPVQNYLLDKRTVVQSVYRDLTGQLPTSKAPVTLIHIDQQSLTDAGIDRPVPMDRSYLASLIDRLVAADAQIIGIDYLFDYTQPEKDSILAQSISNAVEQEQTWFIFGAYKQINGQEVGVSSATNIGSPNWTLQGYVDGLPSYMSLLPESANCKQACPFAYLLATVQKISLESPHLQPNIKSQTNLRDSIYNYVRRQEDYQFLQETKLPTISYFLQYLGQQWLRPIQDYSLPSDLVYNRIPAWQLLNEPDLKLNPKTVIIGSGGYPAAGLTPGSDNLPTPSAIAYWNNRRGLGDGETPYTGSEVLAYMTHHWLYRHLITPIPHLWMVLIVLLITKGIKLNLNNQTFITKLLLILFPGALTIYGLIVLQVYISYAVSLPWLLPSITAIALSMSKTNN